MTKKLTAFAWRIIIAKQKFFSKKKRVKKKIFLGLLINNPLCDVQRQLRIRSATVKTLTIPSKLSRQTHVNYSCQVLKTNYLAHVRRAVKRVI